MGRAPPTMPFPLILLQVRSIATSISKPNSTTRRFSFALRQRQLFRRTKKINRYSMRGRLDKALQLFDEMLHKDVPFWNATLKGCLQRGQQQLALDLFRTMPERNAVSWTTMIDALARNGSIAQADELLSKMPFRDTAAWNSVMSRHFRNGNTTKATRLFEEAPLRNSITWSIAISGLARNGKSAEAIPLFRQMVSSGENPTPPTFVSLLTSCCNSKHHHFGVQTHAMVVKSGALFDASVSTSLITFYSKCKQMESSITILEENEVRVVEQWAALISGFGSNGDHPRAIEAFQFMRREGVLPNQSTFTAVLRSCGELVDLERGREVHASATKLGFGSDAFVGSSLIFMYSECGVVDDMLVVFENLIERSLISWNSVITGCVRNRCWLLAFRMYRDMVLDLVQPDEITFVGLLGACCESKFVDMARYLLRVLERDGALEVRVEHQMCMADVLIRCGDLKEAEGLMSRTSLEPDKAVWLRLLSSCRGYLNRLEMGRRIAGEILDQKSHRSAAGKSLMSSCFDR